MSPLGGMGRGAWSGLESRFSLDVHNSQKQITPLKQIGLMRPLRGWRGLAGGRDP